MIEAEADIVLGEAIRPAAEAHRHVYSGGWVALLAAAMLFATIIVAGSMLAGLLIPFLGPLVSNLMAVLAMIVGGVAAVGLYGRLHMRGFLDALRKAGTPDVLRTRFRFDEGGISVETDRLSHHVPWTAILFAMPSSDHWLVQVDTITLAVPRLAFAGRADEQAFVDLAKASLSESAPLVLFLRINSV